MDISTKYKLLTHMPLLQGLSGQDLARLEEIHGLEVETIPSSPQPLLNQGDTCTHLLLVANGVLRRKYVSQDGRIRLAANLHSPLAVEPENLYGLHCHYHNSYFAETDLQVISIRKADVGKCLMNVPVFRYNLLNYLSAVAHKQTLLMTPYPPRTVVGKFLHLLEILCREGDSEISMSVKMTDLALYLEETRLTVSRMLNRLASQQIIGLARSTITLRSLNKLRTYLNETDAYAQTK